MILSFDLDGVFLLFNKPLRDILQQKYNTNIKGNIDINFLNAYPLPDHFQKHVKINNHIWDNQFCLNKPMIKLLRLLKRKNHTIVINTNRKYIGGKVKALIVTLHKKGLIDKVIVASRKWEGDFFKKERCIHHNIDFHMDDNILIAHQISMLPKTISLHFNEESDRYNYYSPHIITVNNKNLFQIFKDLKLI